MEENKDVPMMPKHEAETTYLHLSWANRRMLIALICVCVTFIVTILVFVNGYTVREKNWLDTLQRTGVTDGVHEQPDP